MILPMPSTAHTVPDVRKAVLLAAGRGTRMRELTDDLPKPMIPVRGKPILLHIVEGLKAAGIERFLIVVGYRAEVVETSSAMANPSAPASITSPRSSRTAPAASSISPAISPDADPFVLSYGDILVNPANYLRLTTPAPDQEAIITVKRNEDVSKGGAVFVNDRFELTDLREKPKPGEPTSPWYNAGIYTFRPSIFEFTARLERSPRGEYELTDAIRSLALSGKKVQALELEGDWADVRDPEVLAELNR